MNDLAEFEVQERDAIYRAIATRRDVGRGFLDPDRLREILYIPENIVPVGYLCLGYVERFATEPELERFGWESRIPLEGVVSYDRYCADPEAEKP